MEVSLCSQSRLLFLSYVAHRLCAGNGLLPQSVTIKREAGNVWKGTKSEFDKFISTPAPDICDAGDIQTRSLFRIGEPLNHARFNRITFAIQNPPFSISYPATENSYIFEW